MRAKKHQKLDQVTIFDSCVPDKLGRGGKSKGSGRKKGEKAVVIRAQLRLKEKIEELIRNEKATN